MTTVAEEREIALREFDLFVANNFVVLPDSDTVAVLRIAWIEAWSEGAKRGVQLAFKAIRKAGERL